MKTLTTLSISIALSLGMTANAFAYQPFSPERQQAVIDKIIQRFDTNKDNVITLDEVQAMRDAIFTQADVNVDGFLSSEEFATVATQQRQTHLKEMFNTLDTNKDGNLSLDESLQQPSGYPDGKKARFAMMDTNQDGVVSFEEFQQGKLNMRAGQGMQGGHWLGVGEGCNDLQSCLQSRFNMLDANKDSKISRVEFVHTIPLFSRFDTNNDGVITREEIAQQLQNKMQQRGRGWMNTQ